MKLLDLVITLSNFKNQETRKILTWPKCIGIELNWKNLEQNSEVTYNHESSTLGWAVIKNNSLYNFCWKTCHTRLIKLKVVLSTIFHELCMYVGFTKFRWWEMFHTLIWIKYAKCGSNTTTMAYNCKTLSFHFCIFSVKILAVNHDCLSDYSSWKNSCISLNLSRNV